MEQELLIAQMSDAEEIYRVMHEVKNALEDKELYCTDELGYIRENISEKGFIVKACNAAGRIIGFLLVHFPKKEEDNMGHYLNLNQEECQKVAYMDSVAVLPQYRGAGLQKKLAAYAQEAEQMRPYRYFMTTVSPKNSYSLHNFQDMGYQIVCQIQNKYGWERFVLVTVHTEMG